MLELSFKKRINGFSLSAALSEGGHFEVTGLNGSGKSTLLKCIAGYLHIDAGAIKINGRDVTGMGIAERGAVYISHDSYLSSLTVNEHLGWSRQKRTGASEIDRVRERLGIDFDGKVQDLSLGQKMRVSIATAVLSDPDLILLDEVLQNISNRDSFVSELGEICMGRRIQLLSAVQGSASMHYFANRYIIENGQISRLG